MDGIVKVLVVDGSDIDMNLSHEELIALDKEKKRESEKCMREFLERHDSVNQSEFYRMQWKIPHWCFYEVLQEMEDNGEIQREPIYEIKDYKITKK